MDVCSNDVATLIDAALTGAALTGAALEERRKAAHGNPYALERERELENELRRCAGIASTLGAPLEFARPRPPPMPKSVSSWSLMARISVSFDSAANTVVGALVQLRQT